MLSHSGFLVRMTGLDLHFLPQGQKIKVATSVCTDGRNCPPDSFSVMGSSPTPYKEQIPR